MCRCFHRHLTEQCEDHKLFFWLNPFLFYLASSLVTTRLTKAAGYNSKAELVWMGADRREKRFRHRGIHRPICGFRISELTAFQAYLYKNVYFFSFKECIFDHVLLKKWCDRFLGISRDNFIPWQLCDKKILSVVHCRFTAIMTVWCFFHVQTDQSVTPSKVWFPIGCQFS